MDCYSDGPKRKGKDRPKEVEDERYHEKGNKSKKKHSKKGSESPVHHNGYHKNPARTRAPDTEDSDRSDRCVCITSFTIIKLVFHL